MSASNNKFAFRVAAMLLAASALGACDGETTDTLRAKAQAHQDKGELNAALITLKNVVEADPDNAAARHQLATVYLETGDALSAEKEIRMAQQLGYAGDKLAPLLGRALLLQREFKKALAETEAAAPAGKAGLLTVRADTYLGMGEHAKAEQLYTRILASQPKFVPALVGRGRLAQTVGQPEVAQQFSDRALAVAPDDADALLFKGDLLRARNQEAQALAVYDKVLAASPEHRSAHIEKAYVAIRMGKYAIAQSELDAAKRIAPTSVLVTYTQCLLDFSQGRYSAAQDAMQKVLRVAPEHMPTVLLAGAITMQLGLPHQAEHHLRHYLENSPNSVQARKMLASTLLQAGKARDALDVLAPVAPDASQDIQLLALTGESYLHAREFGHAADFFTKASVIDPKAANVRTSLALSKLGKGQEAEAIGDLRLATQLDKSPQAGIALVRTELGLKRYDEALEAVNSLEKAQPGNAAVVDLKGLAWLGKRDDARARALFEQALALEPSYFPATKNLVRLELRDKNPDAAEKHVKAFLAKNPSSVEAMTALASLAARAGKPDETTRWLEAAHGVDQAAIGPAVNLVAHYMQAGQNEKALVLARKLQVGHPEDPDLLDLLGKGQLAVQEYKEALQTYKNLSVIMPHSAQVQMQLAALYIQLKNTVAAEDHLKTAVALQRDFPSAQLALAELYVTKGSYELALMTASHLQANYPKAAAGYQLEGDILMAQAKAPRALAAYEQAMKAGPSSELLVKTANALRLAGKEADSLARIDQWLAKKPADLRVQLFKGEHLMGARQYPAAAAHFEAMVARDPKNVVAMNNLALAYQAMKDPRALKAGEGAYTLAPGQAAVADTYGWILVEGGDTARGLPLLRKASAQAPQAADIRYHLAVGLFKSGDKAGARRELEALRGQNARFAEAEAANALYSQL